MRRTPKHLLVLCGAAIALIVPAARASAPPVGPLPAGPSVTVKVTTGGTFSTTLPKPTVSGGAWRIARPFDSTVVRQVGEATTASGGARVTFRALGEGTTRVVFALTRGERAHAYAARTFRVMVSKGSVSKGEAAGSRCPTNLLQLTANPIGPAVTAALLDDGAANRPQVTGAMIASQDTQRGPQVKAACGTKVSQRTIVVYITDRALLPSQSLSQRVVFVGRTSAGYRIWERAR